VNTWHYAGSGNSMVIVDAQQHPSTLSKAHIIALCSRERLHLPNAEGVLAVRSIVGNHVVADYYNPDGSTGAMCGNGGRTLASWLVNEQHRGYDTPLSITIAGVTYPSRCPDTDVAEIVFSPPRAFHHYPVGALDGISVDVWYVDVGSDHAVVFDVGATFDVLSLRHHKAFTRGVNVNMAHVLSPSVVHLSTFERGVEAITGACGTGAISTAHVCFVRGLASSPVTIMPPSNQPLTVATMPLLIGGTGLALRGPTSIEHPPVEFSPTDLTYSL
jgi:diaminopimelate epimerase